MSACLENNVYADLPGRPIGAQLLGYSRLLEDFRLDTPLPRRLTAVAAVGQKTVIREGGIEWILLPRQSGIRVPDLAIEHIGVALKHEGVDFRVLSRLFKLPIQEELTRYIQSNPAGLYTRRAWFFYEWLTGNELPLDEPYGAQYVPALDPNIYCTRQPTRSRRHKVDNNLPGTPGFCPLIRRTERLATDRIESLADEAREVVSSADPTILRRAVGFMLLNESKGSFGIEGETPPRNRLERWGRLIGEAKDIRLSIATLEKLHRSLFDGTTSFAVYNLRTIGGFVGRHDSRDQTPIPDHISAHQNDLKSLLDDLLQTYELLKSDNFNPLLTAAILSFGFVFIHPFEDGNGRLHRFLLQKALVDMKFNPDGIVLPISAAILEDLLGYRAALEDYSTSTLPFIEWNATKDGNVEVTNETSYLYRYFDATRQAEYLVDRVERTIRFALPAELSYLHKFDDAKRRISELIDLPDRLMSLMIQFCAQNNGHLSAKKRNDYFPNMTDEILESIEEAIQESGIIDLAPGAG